MHRALLRVVLVGAAIGCAAPSGRSDALAARAALDTVHARMSALHRARDASAYAALHGDSVVFEWPGIAPVGGRPALAALMRENWRDRNGLELSVTPVARRVAGPYATEVLAYREAWSDSTGARVVEYGRFVLMLTQSTDAAWVIDRFFGFSDSTRTTPP
jgi:limonene-1,2-epoxide hydrolase